MTGVLQLKVTLEESRPPIWRRIQLLDNSTFFNLHNAIQNAMGWEDYHFITSYSNLAELIDQLLLGSLTKKVCTKSWMKQKF
jgi:hypothetical protein